MRPNTGDSRDNSHVDSKQQQMLGGHRAVREGHGGSRIKYLDSWRISPLLGLRGSSRLLQKQERAQKTGEQVRKKQQQKSCDPGCDG